MRTNRMLMILGLAVAIPVLAASMAFACEKTCSGKAATASAAVATDAKTASAVPAGSKAGCAAKSASSHCAGKTTTAAAEKAAHGADCTGACCAGKSASMITYSVAGMTCGGCVKQVESAVAKLELDNVEKVEVSLDDAAAVITTTGPVDAAAVAEAITKAGFEAKVAASEPAEKAATEESEEPAATM